MASAYLIIQLAWTKKILVCLFGCWVSIVRMVRIWIWNFFENQKRLERLVGISHTNHTTDIDITYDTTLAHITHTGLTHAVLLDFKQISAWRQAKIDEFAHYNILNLKTRKHSNQRILGHKAVYHGGYYIIRARKRRGLTRWPNNFANDFFLFVLFFENDSYFLLICLFFCLT